MTAFIRNPRTGLPAMAIVVTLVLAFAVPPLNSVVAAGSSSSMSSSSSTPVDCNSQFSGGNVKPGDTVRGKLSLDNGCRFIPGRDVRVTLNGNHLDKPADDNGDVSVSVKTNPDGKTGVLDDPVDVTLKQGRNDVIVTGQAIAPPNGDVVNAQVDAFFILGAPTTAPTTPIVVTPVTVQTTTGTTSGGGLARTGMNLFALFLLALVAIALGTYTVAAERSIPVAAGAGAGPVAASVTMPLFDPP